MKEQAASPREFTPLERAILRVVQKNIPDTLTPYADLAAELGTDEQTVLDLLRELKESGAIRRFGASLKHQRAGFAHNAMVAWMVEGPEEADAAGDKIKSLSALSHCYHRPLPEEDGAAEGWPYTFFTMLHGRTEKDCLEAIEEIKALAGLKHYAVLKSVRELKKISMTYF